MKVLLPFVLDLLVALQARREIHVLTVILRPFTRTDSLCKHARKGVNTNL